MDFGRKRLSDGSLPDMRQQQKTLRVTNPDDTTLNDTTLGVFEGGDAFDDDSDDSGFGKLR